MLPAGFLTRAFALSIALASIATAERLSIHTYSIESGLAHNHVSRIRQDSRGYFWFCTDDGLSRWDGYRFRNYTTADGLPHQHIDDLLETRRGEYWVATDGGIARFHPERQSAFFTSYFPSDSSLSRSVNTLAEDKDGTLFLGTGDGLYRMQQTSSEVHFTHEEIGAPQGEHDANLVTSLLVSRDGRLWAGTGSGIYRRNSDGRWEHLGALSRTTENFVNQLREDSAGRVWAGTRGGGLIEFPAGRVFTRANGLPANDVRDILVALDGHLWAATRNGLAEASLETYPNVHFHTYSIADGMAEQSVYSLTEDAAGNLWLGTSQIGAIRVARQHFHTYAESDGFRPQEVNNVMQAANGQVCIAGGNNSTRLVQCFDGRRFSTLPLGRMHVVFGYEWSEFALQDRSGAWWFAAEPGALRVSDASRAPDLVRVQSVSTEPISGSVRHIFNDSRGDVWMAEWTSTASAVVKWSASSHTTHVLWRDPFLPGRRATAPSYFTEDATGQIWVGLSGEGGVLRWRQDHFEALTADDGVPRGEITSMHADNAGRLWISSAEGGLVQVADPAADHPRIREYSRTTGLSTNEIWCIAEDGDGRIYAGTSTGVDVVNPATDHVMRYTADDGLVPGYVRACSCDRTGKLWFVTNRGASQFTPMLELPHAPPRALIAGFHSNGVDSGISQLGAFDVAVKELAPSQNQIAIDFVGIDSRLRGDLRYQYRLVDSGTSWTKPAPERSVTFAGIGPGRYRFEVRALDIFGGISPAAAVQFSIRRPFWQRWWFLLLSVSTACGMLYVLHHYRILRLLELERVRTRIATDLHDDIGSGLSQIAILAEVAQTRVTVDEPYLPVMLSNIASVSRELVQSMSDIVWSVNPHRDRVSDLMQRMRRFASDMLSARNIHFRFEAPAGEQTSSIATDIRREVYLTFKEAITNIVRHSGCTYVAILASIRHGSLELRMEDNGKGFVAAGTDGNGLRNMSERMHRIGGRIEIGTGSDGGALVVLHVPLRSAVAPVSRTT